MYFCYNRKEQNIARNEEHFVDMREGECLHSPFFRTRNMEEEYGTCNIRCQSERWSWKDDFNRQFSGCVGGQWQKSINY